MEHSRTQYQELDRNYAGFWLRFVAYFIDSIILTVAFGIIGFAIAVWGSTSQVFLSSFYVISIAGAWLYHALLESSAWQATVGKRLLDIKVTGEHGKRISFARATGRHFGKILSGLILSIGYIMIAFTEQKQGLHDILAKTLVIKDE